MNASRNFPVNANESSQNLEIIKGRREENNLFRGSFS